MTDTQYIHFTEEDIGVLKEKRNNIFWFGIALSIVGILALIFPVMTTFTTQIFIGVSFLIAGIISFVGSFSLQGTGPFFGALLWSLLVIAASVFFLSHPMESAIAITIFLAVAFMMQGAYELILVFSMDKESPRLWMVLSALISIGLGIVVAAGLPGNSHVFLGIIVGVNFLSSGVSLLLFSNRLKSLA